MDNFDLKKYLAEGRLNEDIFGKYATRKAPKDTADEDNPDYDLYMGNDDPEYRKFYMALKRLIEKSNKKDDKNFEILDWIESLLNHIKPENEEEMNESASAAAIAASAAAIAANATSTSGGGGGASNPWALLTLMVLFSLPVVGIAIEDRGLGDKVRGWINRYKLNRVINRLRKDPEVLEFIKSKKPGIQNFLKSKLTDKEQKYIKQISWNKITKGEIREISNFLEEESIPPLNESITLTPEEKKTLVNILVNKLQYYRDTDWPTPGEEFFAGEIKIVTNILNKTDNLTLTPEEKKILIYFLDMEIIKAASDRSINTDPVTNILKKLK